MHRIRLQAQIHRDNRRERSVFAVGVALVTTVALAGSCYKPAARTPRRHSAPLRAVSGVRAGRAEPVGGSPACGLAARNLWAGLRRAGWPHGTCGRVSGVRLAARNLWADRNLAVFVQVKAKREDLPRNCGSAALLE